MQGGAKRLYQQIADDLRAQIGAGLIAPGSRLPGERELATQLGVSRPSLREALIALEIEGSVEVRMGSGVYVCAPAGEPVAALGDSPSELMDARLALEGPVAARAAARLTPDALAELRAVLEEMGRLIAAGRRPLEEDRRFHLAIAHGAGNPVLVRLVGELFDGRHGTLSARISSRTESPDTWAAALREHEAILAALEAADPLGAEAGMRHHLRRSAERWTAD